MDSLPKVEMGMLVIVVPLFHLNSTHTRTEEMGNFLAETGHTQCT